MRCWSTRLEMEFSLVSTMLAVALTSTFSDGRADLHRRVDLNIVVDHQFDAGLNVILKSRGLHFKAIGADRKIWQCVTAAGVRFGGVDLMFAEFRHGDVGVDDGGAGGIGDLAAYLRDGGNLGIRRGRITRGKERPRQAAHALANVDRDALEHNYPLKKQTLLIRLLAAKY